MSLGRKNVALEVHGHDGDEEVEYEVGWAMVPPSGLSVLPLATGLVFDGYSPGSRRQCTWRGGMELGASAALVSPPDKEEGRESLWVPWTAGILMWTVAIMRIPTRHGCHAEPRCHLSQGGSRKRQGLRV